jgi:hypothetical protein
MLAGFSLSPEYVQSWEHSCPFCLPRNMLITQMSSILSAMGPGLLTKMPPSLSSIQ